MNQGELNIDKIKTRILGLDDLFYGGLRLPDPRQSKKMDGICIVIRGKQGVAKSDLAMQIMRGVNKSLADMDNSSNKLTPFFCTLNHRTSEWVRKYRGLEIMEAIENAKQPIPDNEAAIGCNICPYFTDLPGKAGFPEVRHNNTEKGCTVGIANSCTLCKLLRQELISYNPRTQSLHWNLGRSSDNNNLIASLFDDEEYTEKNIPTKDIFPSDDWYNKSSGYISQSLYVFKELQSFINKKKTDLEKSNNDNHFFSLSSIVVEGFSIFDNENLERLPYDDLINDLRKVAAVTILVFDERATNLQIKSDIIIEMQKREDEKFRYQYRELQIVKSDLQPRIRGWHRCSLAHDMKVRVYPNISALMSKRFAKENAVPRMEHSRMDYPQSLLERMWMAYDKLDLPDKENNVRQILPQLLKDILKQKKNHNIPFKPESVPLSVSLIEDDIAYRDLFYDLNIEGGRQDTTILYVLLGKTEQNLRKEISGKGFLDKTLQNIHYWNVNFMYTWPEIVADSIKQFVNRWIRSAKQKKLHLVIDDFAYIIQYPFLSKESMFAPAIVSVCNSELEKYRYKNDMNGNISLHLSFVCMSENNMHYRVIKQLSEIYKF